MNEQQSSDQEAIHRPYVLNPRGHVWAIDECDGDVDIFAFECGHYCNGPKCINCGYGFCHHCESGPDHDCTAVGKNEVQL